MVQLHSKKLITVITESILENKIIEEFRSKGIKGFTIMEARGHGESGDRDANLDADKNIRIEAICEENKAHGLLEQLEEKYYKNYAMVAFLSSVEVLRNEKF